VNFVAGNSKNLQKSVKPLNVFTFRPMAQVTVDLIEFIFQFSELRCERSFVYSLDFVARNLKQITKIGFGRKNQSSSHCVHIPGFRNFSILKM
jgi:hypothetical protein